MKPASHKPSNLHLHKVNPVVRYLIVSDMLVVGAMGMLGPLYALFVTDYVKGANELVIGMSMTVYLFARSILQIPTATLIDKIKGEKDDYYYMVIFSIVVGLLHLALLKITTVPQLYLFQLFMGICSAITYPSYMAIFTRHIDAHIEGTEWGVYYTFVDLSSAALAAMGGYIANQWGFPSLIWTVSIGCTVGALLLIPIKPYLYKLENKLY